MYAGELGFEITSDRRTILCPDVSFIKTERTPPSSERAFFKGAPDLAVEVISASERPSQVQTKVARYLEGGTTLVWCVYPEKQQVVVYNNIDPPRIVGEADSLSGGVLLPGLSISLSGLFAEL